MENSLSPMEKKQTLIWAGRILAIAIPMFIFGRCTAPTPQPVMFTKVNVVEVEKIVTEFEETNSQRECMAQALFAEFRGEKKTAAIAGGEVVLNRVKDRRYPPTICEVVRYKNKGVYHFSYQDKSDPNFYKTARVFADMHVTPIELRARERAYEVADTVMAGIPSLPKNALNYHTTAVSPDWADKLQKHSQIGVTVFYTGY